MSARPIQPSFISYSTSDLRDPPLPVTSVISEIPDVNLPETPLPNQITTRSLTSQTSEDTINRKSTMCLSYSQSNLHSVMMQETTDEDQVLCTSGYVKALFDFEPTHEIAIPAPGLQFRRGQVLYLVNSADNQWWRARRVLPDGTIESGIGLIPSRARVENRERRRRRHVQFNPAAIERVTECLKKRSTKLGHSPMSFIKMISRKAVGIKAKQSSTNVTVPLTNGCEEQGCSSYEPVRKASACQTRPVVLVGASVERVADDLLWLHKENYVGVEVDDEDLVDKLKQAALDKKHALLNGELAGCLYNDLYANRLYPLTVFIRPIDSEQLVEWNRRLSLSEARVQLQQLDQVEMRISRHLTARVNGNTPEEISRTVFELVARSETSACWIPARPTINKAQSMNNIL